MWQRYKKWLEQLFARSSEIEGELSENWRHNVNRRSVAALIVIGIVLTFAYVMFIEPPADFPTRELISIPQGQSLKQIATTLKETGVIKNKLTFRIMVTILGRQRGVFAGDYVFKEPADVYHVARSLAFGQYGLEPIKIRISEGSTMNQMAAIFSTQLDRFNKDKFLQRSVELEGFLFPDTYFFLPNANEDTVIQAMQSNFDTHMSGLQSKIASSTHSLRDIVTVASIVEREAHNSADRKVIAGVIWNRLQKDIPLQVDVTFLYTIGKGTFQLTMKDLTSDSPYNTYVNKGLPPTPIGSPSLDSLTATVNPTKSDYIYFLADRAGVTHFCRTYACQLANKDLYF